MVLGHIRTYKGYVSNCFNVGAWRLRTKKHKMIENLFDIGFVIREPNVFRRVFVLIPT